MTLPAFFSRCCCGVVLAVLVGAVLTAQARADDPVPKPISPDHYNRMAAHSPFAPPTEAPRTQVAAPTPPPGPSWSDKLTVTMITQVDGVFYVTVVDPDSPQHLYLSSDAVDQPSQMKVESVKWNPAEGDEEPAITLSKGAQHGTVRYDPGSAGVVSAVPRPVGMPAPNNFRPNLPPTALPGITNQPLPVTSPNALRRGPIRAMPAPASGGAGRPVVLPGEARVQPARPGPQVKTDDDDDDD